MNYSKQEQYIDPDGYRKNVGLIVCNNRRQVLWARSVRHKGWQFPQGGVDRKESALEAAYRELHEEVGLTDENVKLLGSTKNWLYYDVPSSIKRRSRRNNQYFRGQKQRWFLFHLLAGESCIKLDTTTTPEFGQWQWIDYWLPLQKVVTFKRDVYQKSLKELEPLLTSIGVD